MLSTDFVKGSPNWLDLGSPDTTAAAAFYRAVFDWDFESAGPDAGGYGLFQQEGQTIAGLGPLTEEGASSAWTVYFETPDADATAAAVKKSGGTVRVEPFDVMEMGRMSPLTDPAGADFAIWQPGTFHGSELLGEPTSLAWVELHGVDRAAALSFYGGLFGWRSQEFEMPGMTYTVLSTAEGDPRDASFGGIVPDSHGQDPHWIAYFEVADPDDVVERARHNGGSLLMPAADVPEVGRIAWLADPFGAPFAIIRSAPQPE
ncbi:VOC family protein [Embleya scabrispora]|uniref:VOC family protein n=1 Tax=Embleya scabrispora TaxID=159449 RepID=UPI00036B08F3|nr:VOC family protein [Embleya scabrispora]MYS78878.1 VOC family protein [Streptomyces sp. SID5474]